MPDALINHLEGTLERLLGDGLVVLRNGPIPCPDPAVRDLVTAKPLGSIARFQSVVPIFSVVAARA